MFLSLKNIKDSNILHELNTNCWFNIQVFPLLLIIIFILYCLQIINLTFKKKFLS